MPVWLISSGSQPLARAWVTSPGEQASMPTLPGVPGRAHRAQDREDPRVRAGLEREAGDVRDAGAGEGRLERAHVLARAREVVDEERRAVLAGERLEVRAVERPGGRRPRRGPGGATRWGPGRRAAPGQGHAVAHGRRARRGSRAGVRSRSGRTGRDQRPAGDGVRERVRALGHRRPDGPQEPLRDRGDLVHGGLERLGVAGGGLSEPADLAHVLEGGGLRLPGGGGSGLLGADGAGGCCGTCRAGYCARLGAASIRTFPAA